MKRFLVLLSTVLGFAALAQPIPQTTAFMRSIMLATNAAHARSLLGSSESTATNLASDLSVTNIQLVTPKNFTATNISATTFNGATLNITTTANLPSGASLTNAAMYDPLFYASATSNFVFYLTGSNQVLGVKIGDPSTYSVFRVERNASGDGRLVIAGNGVATGTDATEYTYLQSGAQGLGITPGKGGVQINSNVRVGADTGQAPLYPLQVGTNNTYSTDPYVSIGAMRTVDTGNNWHGFSDSTYVDRSDGKAFNSFDARVFVGGTGNYDHYAAFQSLPMVGTSGDFTNWYGYYSGVNATNGVNFQRFYGVYSVQPSLTGGSTVETNILGYFGPATAGATENWSIYAAGPARLDSVTIAGTITAGTQPGIAATVDVLTSASSTNRLVWVGGILVSNIADYNP